MYCVSTLYYRLSVITLREDCACLPVGIRFGQCTIRLFSIDARRFVMRCIKDQVLVGAMSYLISCLILMTRSFMCSKCFR